MGATVTVNDVLDGYVRLDIACMDRIYVSGYVPSLQGGWAGGCLRTQDNRRSLDHRAWLAGERQVCNGNAGRNRIAPISSRSRSICGGLDPAKPEFEVKFWRRTLDAACSTAEPNRI